jgi:hypothetical protein
MPGPEQPLRPEQQHADEDHEDADLAQRFAQQQPAQRLDHADQQPAQQRAGKAAHAAQHHDGEGHQHEARADLRVDVVGRQQEAGGRAQAGQADAEAHRVDMVDVDAHQLGALLFLGHRADRAAEVGARHDEQQQRRRHQRAGQGHQLGQRDEGRADGHGGQRVGVSRSCACRS